MVIRTQSTIPAEVKKALAETPVKKPDIPTLKEMVESHIKEEPKKPRSKKAVSIRLDPDIVEFHKKDGPGWQTRINTILRSHMEKQS